MTENGISAGGTGPSGPDLVTDDRPSQIGPYRILDTLGEGGMSVVYLAEQSEPVRRRVALKILKPGMDSKQVVARFESERQALAVLDHPNIAKIFDGGVAESGRPYFVMEQVKGVPITDYCDDHQLNNEERLKVFIKVCSAVQHAHLKGLIHRDLKPSNILVGVVDGEPQPKIIDFGIAKATTATLTEATLYTRVGQIIGTPQYMSPEQANLTGLDIDTRTDIYSLGVVLYELLVGTVPLDLQAFGDQAMQVVLRERDPPRPSTRFTELGDTREELAKVRGTDPDRLRQQLRGDLDWIVMNAIEKDRTRRYETVNALAMECRRFLKHEPVLARPPSTAYHLQRFVRRNRLIVIAASIAILAIIAGATAATLGYFRATEAELVAVKEAEAASQISNFLVELFEVSDPSEARGNSITAREVLDRGTTAIEEELAEQPEVQATLMLTMGQVYQNLGLLTVAEELLENALNVRRSNFPEDHAAIADVLHDMTALKIAQGNFDRAEELARETLGLRQKLYGDIHEDVGHTLSNLATLAYYRSEYEDSLELFRRTFEVFEATLGEDHPDVIDTLTSLGSVYWRTGDTDEAIRIMRLALERKRRHVGDDHPDTAILYNNVAILLKDQGDMDAAEPLYLKALDIQKRQLGEHAMVANTMNNIGMFYLTTGELEKAEPMMLDALAMWTRTLGEDNVKVHTARHNLGQLNIDRGSLEQAEEYLNQALAARRELFGDEHEDTASSMMFLCDVYNLTGRYGQSEQMARDVIRIYETTLPTGHRLIAAAYIRLGSSLAGVQRYEEAEEIILRNYASIRESSLNSLTERRARQWVTRLYESWNKPEEAARYRP